MDRQALKVGFRDGDASSESISYTATMRRTRVGQFTVLALRLGKETRRDSLDTTKLRAAIPRSPILSCVRVLFPNCWLLLLPKEVLRRC